MLYSQDRIDHGVLIRWTKGFGNPNVEGHDVGAIFRASMAKYPVLAQVQLTALINDTTGTLIASHYVNPRTKIAVILGTGCNAAYMEKVENITKIASLGIPGDQEMAINCEWVGRARSCSLRVYSPCYKSADILRAPSTLSIINISHAHLMTSSLTSNLTNRVNNLSRFALLLPKASYCF